jgi:gliding motility-associated-like protein
LNNFPTDSTIYVPVVNGATYFVLVDNGFCNQKDSVVLYRKIEGLSVDSIPGMCDNTSQQVSANNTQPQFPFTYLWSPASAIVGSNSGNSITILPDSSQFIYVTMTDSDGCVYRDSAFVIVKNFDSLTISATAVPDLIPSGGTSQLNVATNGSQINWSPELLVTNAQISNPKTQKLLNDQEFLVIVSDGFCSKSTTVEVNTYDFACDGRLVYVPNAFSPNGDGENDILFVRTLVTEELLLRVFNRWGEMVFETTDKNVGWDGTFKGKLLDPDVYDYYIKAICIDGGEYEHKGNITLLR